MATDKGRRPPGNGVSGGCDDGGMNRALLLPLAVVPLLALAACSTGASATAPAPTVTVTTTATPTPTAKATTAAKAKTPTKVTVPPANPSALTMVSWYDTVYGQCPAWFPLDPKALVGNLDGFNCRSRNVIVLAGDQRTIDGIARGMASPIVAGEGWAVAGDRTVVRAVAKAGGLTPRNL